MDIRLRLLTAEIAILTAVASLFATNTEEWTKVYERRLYAEMALNLWRSGNEQTKSEEILSGLDPVPARAEGTEEAPLVLVGEVVNEPQTSEEAPTAQQTRSEEVVEEVPQSSPAPVITITEMSSTQKETQKTKEETGNESQAGDESQIQPCFESETLEGIQPEIQAGAQSEAQTQVAAKGMDPESEGVSEQEAEEETGSERQTVQEVAVETLSQDSTAGLEPFCAADTASDDQTKSSYETGLNGPEPVDDITSHTEAAVMAVVQDPPLYSVNGAVMPAELQEYLYRRLTDCGIEWFMPYAVLIAYQESTFDIYAQNGNGLDKGLFQYRQPYWQEFTQEAGRSGADIFDPYAQIDVFVFQMARRAFQGFDVNSMISKHNMSDYGPYNQGYVDQVLQHMTVLAAY